MPTYKAPLSDMQFLLNDVWNLQQQLQGIPQYAEITNDVIDAVLEEAAKFSEKVIFPLNMSADQQGCKFNNGVVTTPNGFKDAYRLFCEGGWPALTGDSKFGGQGLPHMLAMMVEEMLCSSSVNFSLYLKLTQGVCKAINQHATEELKKTYLPKLISGEWSGAMCLTESHCGSDLSLVRTKAELQKNNTYHVNGTKIFITSGEHDLTDNIIHLVLARTPDAPAGIKGISLFLVPKFLVNADGSLGARNGIRCSSIEHKMGIKGSATCVINYDNAEGYLIGTLNQGMAAMFTVMNVERLCIGVEGLGLAEASYQNARNYAKDRLQGRALDSKNSAAADPIIVHPDVRRMLLNVKSFTEGARALMAWVASHIDRSHHPDATIQKRSQALVELFTPIIKAYFTDTGFESCNTALQVLGGHGYISEWGMEQFVRDARISQIYEGTNGIQALDLVRRKLIANNGEFFNYFVAEVTEFMNSQANNKELSSQLIALKNALQTLQATTTWIMDATKQNVNEMGAAASDYLKLFALVSLAFIWTKVVSVAVPRKNEPFCQTKLETAEFYFARVLPQIESLEKIIKAGSKTLIQMRVEEF